MHDNDGIGVSSKSLEVGWCRVVWLSATVYSVKPPVLRVPLPIDMSSDIKIYTLCHPALLYTLKQLCVGGIASSIARRSLMNAVITKFLKLFRTRPSLVFSSFHINEKLQTVKIALKLHYPFTRNRVFAVFIWTLDFCVTNNSQEWSLINWKFWGARKVLCSPSVVEGHDPVNTVCYGSMWCKAPSI